jgi:hypothetical protein
MTVPDNVEALSVPKFKGAISFYCSVVHTFEAGLLSGGEHFRSILDSGR